MDFRYNNSVSMTNGGDRYAFILVRNRSPPDARSAIRAFRSCACWRTHSSSGSRIFNDDFDKYILSIIAEQPTKVKRLSQNCVACVTQIVGVVCTVSLKERGVCLCLSSGSRCAMKTCGITDSDLR